MSAGGSSGSLKPQTTGSIARIGDTIKEELPGVMDDPAMVELAETAVLLARRLPIPPWIIGQCRGLSQEQQAVVWGSTIAYALGLILSERSKGKGE